MDHIYFYNIQVPDLPTTTLQHILLNSPALDSPFRLFLFHRMLYFLAPQYNRRNHMEEESRESSLSKGQQMEREENKLKEMMVEQYYKYISLVRLTKNFEKRAAAYEQIDFAKYTGQIAIVGNIIQIQMDKDSQYKDYCYPIVQTPINKLIFKSGEQVYAKKPIQPIQRKLIISITQYRKTLLLPFNKMIALAKKDKEQIFIFTHLKLHLKSHNELCLSLTDKSYIMQLDSEFYQCMFRPMELSLQYNYSELKMSQIYEEGEGMKSNTFVIQDIKSKINENINNLTVLGVLKKINQESLTKSVNAKEKEAILDIIQDVYSAGYKQIGICRMYVRFDILDSQQMEKHLKQGCVYAFSVKEVILTESLNLSFKLNHWKKNFVRITSDPIKLEPINNRYQQMQITELNELLNPSIMRNKMKFKVVKYEVKFFYIKVNCEKCEGSLGRSGQYEYFCRNGCINIHGDLKLWIIMTVMDPSFYAELNIENRQALEFFDIEGDEARIKDEFLKEELQPNAGLMLYFKKGKDYEREDDLSNQGSVYDRNAYLNQLLFRCLIPVIEKEVIGIARNNMSDNFKNFDQDVKNEFQTSFVGTKEYLKKAKVFSNGLLKNTDNGMKLIPYIKVDRVLNKD